MKSRIGQHMWKLALMSALVVVVFAMAAGSAFAAGALTEPSWVVGNSQLGATDVNYTFSFTTASSGIIKTITMTLPENTVASAGGGKPAVDVFYGVGAGSLGISGNVLTYTVTTPGGATAAGTPIYIAVEGLTNTSNAQTFASVITTKVEAGTSIDTATTPGILFDINTTAVTVDVAQTLLFTNSVSDFKLGIDPTNTTNQSRDVTLTVKTNATDGYTLSVKDSGLVSGHGTDEIAPVTNGSDFDSGVIGFGFKPDVTSASLGTVGGSVTEAKYYGYNHDGTVVMTNSGPTGNTADSVKLTNKVAVDFTQPAGNYTDTITYTVTPAYQ